MEPKVAFPTTYSNINQLWAAVLIEELIRHEITDFCIAPGSRCTPLTLAIAKHKKAKAHVHFDERGLGFLALGMAQASQKPIVVVTTSGSAVANLYPAVIEARQSGLPLIILSADRPATLLNCGANQAIDQHSIFANYPIYFAQLVQPSIEININYLLTTIDHGLSCQQNQPAPIHLNIAFSDPLYPSAKNINYQTYLTSLNNWRLTSTPFTQYIKATSLAPLPGINLSNKKVLVIIGKLPNKQDAQAISDYCIMNHLPLLADIQSSQVSSPNNLHYYDLLLINQDFKKQLMQADVLVQFGEQLISKRLSSLMSDFNGERHLVQQNEKRIDPDHQLNIRFNGSVKQWIASQPILSPSSNKKWQQSLRKYHDKLSNSVIVPFITSQPFSEMAVIEQLDTLLTTASPLFIGNSMPIRIADMIMAKNNATIFSNRGASGIDGLLASAIGVAKSYQQVTTLLIGDCSFLYDLNSLALLKQLNTPFIIILINNDGGAIFNLLPVPEKQKEEFYQLPHGLNFKASCAQFGIDYYKPNQLDDFKTTYIKCLQGKQALIEVTLANQQSATQLEQLKEQIQDATL